jgi:hypothetical protein
MSSVSNTTLIVSTSSASLVRQAMSPRRAPEATEAGYSLAKLRSPKMAARRSSRRGALARRLLSVLIVSVAVCLAGACASSIRSIVGGWRCGGHEVMAARNVGQMVWKMAGAAAAMRRCSSSIGRRRGRYTCNGSEKRDASSTKAEVLRRAGPRDSERPAGKGNAGLGRNCRC